jgi:hypothetical protein
LETERRSYRQVVGLYEEADCFVFTVADQPVMLSLDPETSLFRSLYKEEIPATINDLRASRSQLVVIADGSEKIYKASRDLLKALHWLKADVVSEKEFAKMIPVYSDILVLGRPKMDVLKPAALKTTPEEKHKFKIPDIMIPEDEVFFMVKSRKGPGQGVIAHYLPGSIAAARDTSRRISHYGRYSYLTFKGGRNQLKGTWEPGTSPLKVLFDKDK